jgi:hypothetical protein
MNPKLLCERCGGGSYLGQRLCWECREAEGTRFLAEQLSPFVVPPPQPIRSPTAEEQPTP